MFYEDLQKDAAFLFMLLLGSLCGERMETFCSCRIKLWRGRGGVSFARIEIEDNGKNCGILLLLNSENSTGQVTVRNQRLVSLKGNLAWRCWSPSF